MKVHKLIAIAALAAASLGMSHAATITQTRAFSGALADGNPAYASNLTFAGFDTSLGTLDSVTITLSDVSTSGTLTVTNNGAQVSNVKGIGYNGSFVVSDGIHDAVGADFSYSQGNLNGGATAPNIATIAGNGGSQQFGPSSSSAIDPQSVTITGDLSNYTSGAGVDVSVEGYVGSSIRQYGSSNVNLALLASGAGTVTLTYNYTAYAAVPEPAETGSALLGLGTLILVVRKLARRKSALA